MRQEFEIIWRSESSRDFLEDLKSFAKFLDYYRITYDLTQKDEAKFVYLAGSSYRVSPTGGQDAFACSECGKTSFEVMEGDYDGKPALGLCCLSCDSYGAVFPAGL